MKLIVNFMDSLAGRAVRVLLGIGLILWGVLGLGGASGIVVAIIGVLPLLAGVLDVCVLAPAFGYPLSGSRIRASR